MTTEYVNLLETKVKQYELEIDSLKRQLEDYQQHFKLKIYCIGSHNIVTLFSIYVGEYHMVDYRWNDKEFGYRRELSSKNKNIDTNFSFDSSKKLGIKLLIENEMVDIKDIKYILSAIKCDYFICDVYLESKRILSINK